MSPKLNTRNSIIGAAGAAAIGLLLFNPGGTTSAAFSDTDNSNSFVVTTATLDLEATDADGTDVKLNYDELIPGETQVDKFTVKNVGTTPMNLTMGAPFNPGPRDFPATEQNLLTFSVDGLVPSMPVNGFNDTVSLGSLNPGKSRTYVVRVALDGQASDVWQGKSAQVGFSVNGTQQ